MLPQPGDAAQHPTAGEDGALPFIAATPYFVLSRRAELAYLRIPKAACSSIQAALLAVQDPSRHAELQPELRTGVGKLHTTPGLFETTASATEFLRFTFVRHPIRRVISHYQNQVNLGPTESPERRERLTRELAASDLALQMSFPDYVARIIDSPLAARNIHVRPQVEMLFGAKGVQVDFVGSVEDLQRGWRMLQRLSLAPLPALECLNRTAADEGARLLRDLREDLRHKLARRYADDLRLFGYSPDTLS